MAWLIPIGIVALLVVVLVWRARRTPTEDEVRRTVRRMYDRYKRKHPDQPENKILLGVLSARLIMLDWETRRQMASAAGNIDKLVEVIINYEFREQFRDRPHGFSNEPKRAP